MPVNTEKHASETNRFLKLLANELGNSNDTAHASRVLVAVFYTLRDRIPVETSIHLISQLPMILKGVYVEGWNVSSHSDSNTMEEFLAELRRHAGRSNVKVLCDDLQSRDQVQAVLRVMGNYISKGEMKRLRDVLPKKIAGSLFEDL